MAAGEDERIRLPSRAVGSAALGYLGGLVAGTAGYLAVALVLLLAFDSEWLPPAVVGSVAGTWTVLFVTVRRASRRYGTGDVVADFGFRVRRVDLLRGVGLLFTAYVAATFVLAFIAGNPELNGTNTSEISDQQGSVAGLLLFGAVTVVGAPIFEELFFRGLLQRALEPRFGEVGASLLQAVAFGLVHVQPGLGLGNVSVVLTTATLGAVLGQGVRIWRRLGPGIVAHAVFNVVAVAFAIAGT